MAGDASLLKVLAANRHCISCEDGLQEGVPVSEPKGWAVGVSAVVFYLFKVRL